MEKEKKELNEKELEKVGGGVTKSNYSCESYEARDGLKTSLTYCRNCKHWTKDPSNAAIGDCELGKNSSSGFRVPI